MHPRPFRILFSPMIYIIFLILSSFLIGCNSSSTQPIKITPPTTTSTNKPLITWPFNPKDGQWDIINGYREGDHTGYAMWAMDFAKCLPSSVNTLNGTCNNPNGSGWDKTNTVGADVYAPVSGTIVWPDNNCYGLSIEIDGHPGYRVVLFHVDPPPGETWSDLASKHVHYRQSLDKIGKVSAGFCSQSGTTGYHIHMGLYHCTTNCTNDPVDQRVGDPFSNAWAIDNCHYPDDGKTSNEYQGVLLPCNSIATPPPSPITTFSPTPVQRTLTSQQTQSQTVNATGQKTTPGTQAKGILRFREPYINTGPFTFNAGTVFTDDPGNNPNIQMMIDATITVPADHTSVYVSAHVVQIGTVGNIQIGQWTHYLNHNDAEPVDISNSTPFTGGKDPQTYTVVQQSDIDTAAYSLKASTKQSAMADLRSGLRPNEHLVGNSQCTYNITANHVAGDQATTVTVTVQATCIATAST